MAAMTEAQPPAHHKPAFGWFKRKDAAASSSKMTADNGPDRETSQASHVARDPPRISLRLPGETSQAASNDRASEGASTTAQDTHASTELPRIDPAAHVSRPSLIDASIDAPSSRRSSFFRLPRRKKTSISINQDPKRAPTMRKSMDTSLPFLRASGESSRLTFEGIRATFESIKRPGMSTRSSAASLKTLPVGRGSSSALVAASTTSAAQGSPRVEIANPLERLALSRHQSLHSISSLHSARSSPAPDRISRTGESIAEGSNGSLLGKSRGRSLTYGGQASARKSSGTRTSKFFSMTKLKRDMDDPLSSLGLPISASRGVSPMPPLSPAKTLDEMLPIPTPALPDRQEEESPHAFVERLEGQIPHNVIASVLASSDDAFHLDCLKLYMQNLDFAQDPLDMALRKLLMDTKLPKETQQIDRVIDTFSERYQICNPRLFKSRETPHILTFALIMLHTDRFNQANKYKMTKQQFIKNTTSDQTDEVHSDVLEYFYDNIVSTPFILVEDESTQSPAPESARTPTEFGASRASTMTSSMTSLQANSANFSRRSVDVYSLIMEKKLSTLRPQLADILSKPMTLSYTGSLPVINVAKLHHAFIHAARLQLVSERSRPEAYINEDGKQDPFATEPGLVDVKITKIGMLKKKEQKRANSKAVYREWGVMLTGSQLLFFKDVGWVRHYMQQILEHKQTSMLTLTPPVHNYSPDTYMPTAHTLAFHDLEAKKRTHFAFLGRGGELAEFSASSEEEMNDWVAKINYTAAFHTASITIRGIEANAAAEASSKAGRRARRHGSSSTLSSIAQSLPKDIDRQPEVVAARQNLMRQKISEMDAQLVEREAKLQQSYRHAQCLAILTPILPRTRQHLRSSAAACSAKISWQRQDLLRTQCHRDILVKDLELELDPKAHAYTGAARPASPNAASVDSSQRASIHMSPSKAKLNSVGQAIRQASSDTIKRVNRQFTTQEARRAGNAARSIQPEMQEVTEVDVANDTAAVGPKSPFQFGRGTQSSGSRSAGTTESHRAESRSERNARPQTAPNLSLEIPRRPSFQMLKRRASRDSRPSVEDSGLSSPTSMRSGSFLLHGRKVSVVQTPVALVSPIKEAKDRDSGRIWPDALVRSSSPQSTSEPATSSITGMMAYQQSNGTQSSESFQDAQQEFESRGDE